MAPGAPRARLRPQNSRFRLTGRIMFGPTSGQIRLYGVGWLCFGGGFRSYGQVKRNPLHTSW